MIKALVRKNDYGFSISANGKEKDSNEDTIKAYMNCQFKFKPEFSNSALIEINDAFFSAYKTREGIPMVKLVIMDYKVIQEYENHNNKPTEPVKETKVSELKPTDTDSLPF